MGLPETMEEAGAFKKAIGGPSEPCDNKNASQLSNVRMDGHENAVSIHDEGV